MVEAALFGGKKSLKNGAPPQKKKQKSSEFKPFVFVRVSLYT